MLLEVFFVSKAKSSTNFEVGVAEVSRWAFLKESDLLWSLSVRTLDMSFLLDRQKRARGVGLL